MIFVTVGTALKGIDFLRLVREMDRVAGVLDHDVLIQTGPVDYEPEHARFVRYVRFDEARKLFREADLIVGHCGTGTVLNALRFQKPMVIVPRRLDAGELSKDDHQVQLAAGIERMDGVWIVYEVGELESAVRAALARPGPVVRTSPLKAQFVEAVRTFLSGPR
ncbi:MAG TPA: glycosyltransferase [Phycisphaerae bacterium]|nr:glycosyltransferase [Phycisphaerae bacterium]